MSKAAQTHNLSLEGSFALGVDAQDGYRSYFLAYPGKKEGIVILTNTSPGSSTRGAEALVNEVIVRFKEVY